MFHNTATTNFTKQRFLFWIALILLLAATGMAQEPPSKPPEDQTQENKAEPADQDQQPIPVPIRTDEETKSLGGQTFIDDVFQNKRNRWGFSLGTYEAYSTDVSSSDQRRQPSGITAFMARTFFNVGRRKSQFHLDFGTGYSHYSQASDLNSWDYYGGAQYSYQLSTRTSFHIGDQITSSYNDTWPFMSLYSPIGYNYSFSNEVLFNRQRITQNTLRAELGYQVSRKSHLGLYGGYNLYRYPQNTLGNEDALEAGVSFNYRITKWLYLTNGYSVYLNDVDEQFRDSRIHQLQFGGLDFHLGRSWRLWLGGGANISNQDEGFYFGESVNAGIGYTSRSSEFSLTYQKGLTSAIGISQLLNSDIVSASYGYRITRWMSANLQSSYYRSYELNSDGALETLSGGGGLQFALRRDLIASMSAYYQNQITYDFSIQGLDLNRFSVYVGLQYVWP